MNHTTIARSVETTCAKASQSLAAHRAVIALLVCCICLASGSKSDSEAPQAISGRFVDTLRVRRIELVNPAIGAESTVAPMAVLQASPEGPHVSLLSPDGVETLSLSGFEGGGRIALSDPRGHPSAVLGHGPGVDGGMLTIFGEDGEVAAMIMRVKSRGSMLVLYDESGQESTIQR